MSSRDTYNTSVKNAALTKAAADLLTEMTKQVTIDAQRSVVALKLQNGNSALLTAIANANAAATASLLLNEHNKQTTINVAKDTLKQSGDNGSA